MVRLGPGTGRQRPARSSHTTPACSWHVRSPRGSNCSKCNSKARSACRHPNSCAACRPPHSPNSGWAEAVAQVSPARKAAFEILRTLGRGQAHSDDLLRGKAVSALTSQDRNLATALVLGALRWQLELDQRLSPLLKRPNAKLDSEVLIALRLGAFQLLHMDRIPARAAIDESVELAKQAGHRFASGMVNAVLRKVTAAAKDTRGLAEVCSTTESAAVEAHPAWMVERWDEFFGKQATCVLCG